MSETAKAKPATRNASRSTRQATRFEDDAEHALKEIVAVAAKSAGQGDDGASVSREKPTKSAR